MTVYITNMQQATPVAPLTLNEGWSQITALLTHLEDGLFGPGSDNPSAFTPAMYAEVHSIAYAMCTQKPLLCTDLYRRIGIHAAEVARKAYVNGKQRNMELYIKKLRSVFNYLERSFIPRWQLPNVSEAVREAFKHARSAEMEIGAALSKLSLATAALGDEGEPILLDGVGGDSSSSGAGPSGGGRNRNLEPPTSDDSDDSDFELVDQAAFRISPCVTPGLRLGATVLGGKPMQGLFATRRFEKCEAIGVYTGTTMLSSEFDKTKEKIARAYAYQMKQIETTKGTRLSFVIVPPLGADGKVDLKKHPLAALNEPPPGTMASVVMQQMVVPLEQMQKRGAPSDVVEPLSMLVAYTTRRVEPGEQLFLHYGASYSDFRKGYSVGNPSSVQCSNEGVMLHWLFPSGVPWSCVVQIPRNLLDEPKDRDDDPEWKPGRRRRR